MSKISAIILAGGKGKRMNSNIPKQFLKLKGFPVLYYSLKAFEDSPVDEIVLVSSEEERNRCMDIINKYHISKVKKIVAGGEERYDSVYSGLKEIKESDYVLIHDGARPLVDEEIILRNIEAMKQFNACVTGVPSKDTIKISDSDGFVKDTPNRKDVWIVQTPQTFSVPLIYEAYNKLFSMEKSERVHITDDAMVVEQIMKQKVKFVMGSHKNIKITTPEDLETAKCFL